ncbi:Dehydrogenases with different specificities (related to short-chain alcohol dehydrogenases) [Raoultella ornithinolytica]|nr:Dehydrogenases with different specificities (related to short-chain alcohol dehydrogenases) [Raoultella ornithinolytica]
MKIDLSGKVALVTASTAGIGFAIAKGLAASGAEVVVNGRSERSVNEAIARLQTRYPAPGRALPLPTSAVAKGSRSSCRR